MIAAVELGLVGARRELGGVAADEAGVVVARDERRVAEAAAVEREVRLDAAHLYSSSARRMRATARARSSPHTTSLEIIGS